ncbi:transposase [Sorangium sp. So ce315]|uniref:transposase n=1 Tax=Sorangium sp. So ce315 TaxID=3133299 RepID=UPI003F61BF74
MGAELDWESFKAQLPSDWKQRAETMGLIRSQPPQLNAKVTDIEQVLRPLMHRVGLNKSLSSTTAEAGSAGVADLSSVALHKWERKLGPYLATLLADLATEQAEFESWRWAGYEVVIADGTTITRPGATGTTARVHYALRLVDLTIVQLHVTDAHVGETIRMFDLQPNQLWVVDRNYANPPNLAAIFQAGAQILARYNRGALPLHDMRGRSFDGLDHARGVREVGAMREWSVWVHPSGTEPIGGRFCVVRLPEEKAREARERLHYEYGRDVSPEMLEAANWLMVFTTVPRERMSTSQVLEAYRLRWQVELEIKREKSLGGLDGLPNFRPDTISTWLHAKMLLQLVARKIVSAAVAFPPGVSRAGAEVANAASRPSPTSQAHATHRRRNLARHGPGTPGAARRSQLRVPA